MVSLNGKVVMITGASGGLGQAVTKAFSQAGAKVVVVGRELPQTLPEGLLGLAADVTDEVEVQRLMKEAVLKSEALALELPDDAAKPPADTGGETTPPGDGGN